MSLKYLYVIENVDNCFNLLADDNEKSYVDGVELLDLGSCL